jgi:CubicO group peptidase (beta-lactamase class C family)
MWPVGISSLTRVCYKPRTNATRGLFLNHSTNSRLSLAFDEQDKQFGRAFALLKAGIRQRAFPGASVAVTHQGKLIALKGLGRFTYSWLSRRVKAQTVYDLASLTKVIATTAACMRLHEQGQFHLDQNIVEVLPEFGGSDLRRNNVTFRMLLAHSSGLPAYANLYETCKNHAELLAAASQVALAADPDTRSEYSDIGFILLGAALERIAGETLRVFSKREIFRPLENAFTCFNPPGYLDRGRIPPTENDMTFRHRIVQGEVHDENAWVMGGVAGHAGCFAPASDVAEFAQCMLNGGAPLFQRHTVELFTQRQAFPTGTSRALGWDTPSPPSQSGKYFSSRSFGHLGYTGTSLWIDPVRQLSVTLLTNRTWPDRNSQAIKEIRPAFHDAMIEAVE